MKLKKDLILLGIMAVVAVCAAGITAVCSDGGAQDTETVRITASFYPMYVIAQNLTEGVSDVEVSCLTQNQTGCLHDYQITTQDMRTLEHTDVFLINGGGMERFLEDVVKNYPSMYVVNAGESLEGVMKEGHVHEHGEVHEDASEEGHVHEHEESHEELHEDEEGHEELHEDEEAHEKLHEDEAAHAAFHEASGEVQEESAEVHTHAEGNAHFWLDPEYYCVQIQAAADGLSEADSAHAARYQENARVYIAKVKSLAEQMKEELSVPAEGVVVFHDAFVYLAEYLGLEVVHTIEMDSETSLSAGEIAEIVEEVRENNVSVMFTEAQYSTEAAEAIGKETGAASYVIDSLVTGDGHRDSYLSGMETNLAVLKEAFGR